VEFDSGSPRSFLAVSDVSFDLKPSEVFGIVGESGSGKTILTLSMLRLLPAAGRVVRGSIEWRGRDISAFSRDELRNLRGGEIAMIFQDAQASLNPVFSIGRQMEWVLALHQGVRGSEAKETIISLLESVRISSPEKVFHQYPGQLSGGMCQRVMIAMSISCQPKLLIADEPTSALDVTTQAEILDLLEEVKEKIGMAMIFVTHDLGVAARMSDRVGVMHRGEIVESGAPSQIFSSPEQDYTRRLIESVNRSSIPINAA